MSVFVSTPLFPDVPNLPGVPALLRSATSAIGSVPLLELVDATGVLSAFSSPQWGVFDQNMNLVVNAKSVISVDFRGDHKLSDYPVEEGGFATYNKVIRPFEVRVVMTRDGSQSQRAEFLTALETARASIALFQVVTPDMIYLSVNITHVDYVRSAPKGANMLEVNVTLEQVNQTGTTIATSSTGSSSGASPVNGGTVQANPPTTAQSQSLGGRIDSLFGGSLFKGLGLA